jgi:hypothetical protein
MVGRVQTLRSSVVGNRPTGRQPGELYVNWPELQLGVINASGTAQDLLPVRTFSTLSSYAAGDIVRQAGSLWSAIAAVSPGAFVPTAWYQLSTSLNLNSYLPLAGGTMTGLLLLSANPTVALGAATKGYVDTTAVLIAGSTMTGPLALNSDPATAAQAATKRYVDNSIAAIPTVIAIGANRIINGNFSVNQRTYVTNTALAAAAYGHDRWKAGTAGCTYTFTAALPDTTITITAGTLTQVIEAGWIEGGTYTLSWTGTAQARVYQGTPTGAYSASPLTIGALPAGVNTIVEFNTGTLGLAKLEIGSLASLFNRQSLATVLMDCQRYYQLLATLMSAAYGLTSAINYQTFIYPVEPRALPTITFSGITYNNTGSLTLNNTYSTSFMTRFTILSQGMSFVSFIATINAEL